MIPSRERLLLLLGLATHKKINCHNPIVFFFVMPFARKGKVNYENGDIFFISIYSILLFDVLNKVAFAFVSGSLLYLKILCSIFLFDHFMSCIDHTDSLFTRGDIFPFLKKM